MGAAWRIRGFELDRRLGAGASSEVWRARVTSSGDAVALKRLMLSSAEQGRRAVAEAAKLRVLDHPHLVRLHDLVLQRDGAVLVLDLADAGSLADLLTVRGRVTPGEAITAIAPIAAALAHVHAAGVVHGDVSSANILFTRGGLPLLADLGVARLTGDDADAQSTPAYVDPLVARGGVPTSHSDVFMLAAVALHALTGAALWTAPTGDAALAQAATGGLGHVEGRLAVADLPPAMSAVIRRALTLEPHRRGSAADFALDLRHSGDPVAVELAAGRARVAERAAGPATPAAGSSRVPTSRGVAAGAADPRSRRPVPPPATLTRPRRRLEDAADTPVELGRAARPLEGAADVPVVISRTPRPLDGAADVPAPAAPARVPSAAPVSVAQPRPPRAPSAPPRGAGGRHAAVPVKRVRRRDGTDPGAVERVRHVIAGRGRPPGPPVGEPRPDVLTRSVPSPSSDPARPPFARPSSTGPIRSVPDVEVVVGRPAPTSAVARVRPTLPAARQRSRGRTAVTGAGVVVALAAIALAAVLVGRGHSPAVAAPAGVVTSTAAGATPTSTAAAGPPPSKARPASAVLRRLDDLRTRAYATRSVALLRHVYVAGPLRSADAASITRLVPAGCGLHGVRTRFRQLSVRRQRGALVLTVRASLPASHLVCSGRLVRTAPPVRATRLVITLVDRGGTVLIAGERVLSPVRSAGPPARRGG